MVTKIAGITLDKDSFMSDVSNLTSDLVKQQKEFFLDIKSDIKSDGIKTVLFDNMKRVGFGIEGNNAELDKLIDNSVKAWDEMKEAVTENEEDDEYSFDDDEGGGEVDVQGGALKLQAVSARSLDAISANTKVMTTQLGNLIELTQKSVEFQAKDFYIKHGREEEEEDFKSMSMKSMNDLIQQSTTMITMIATALDGDTIRELLSPRMLLRWGAMKVMNPIIKKAASGLDNIIVKHALQSKQKLAKGDFSGSIFDFFNQYVSLTDYNTSKFKSRNAVPEGANTWRNKDSLALTKVIPNLLHDIYNETKAMRRAKGIQAPINNRYLDHTTGTWKTFEEGSKEFQKEMKIIQDTFRYDKKKSPHMAAYERNKNVLELTKNFDPLINALHDANLLDESGKLVDIHKVTRKLGYAKNANHKRREVSKEDALYGDKEVEYENNLYDYINQRDGYDDSEVEGNGKKKKKKKENKPVSDSSGRFGGFGGKILRALGMGAVAPIAGVAAAGMGIGNALKSTDFHRMDGVNNTSGGSSNNNNGSNAGEQALKALGIGALGLGAAALSPAMLLGAGGYYAAQQFKRGGSSSNRAPNPTGASPEDIAEIIANNPEYIEDPDHPRQNIYKYIATQYKDNPNVGKLGHKINPSYFQHTGYDKYKADKKEENKTFWENTMSAFGDDNGIVGTNSDLQAKLRDSIKNGNVVGVGASVLKLVSFNILSLMKVSIKNTWSQIRTLGDIQSRTLYNFKNSLIVAGKSLLTNTWDIGTHLFGETWKSLKAIGNQTIIGSMEVLTDRKLKRDIGRTLRFGGTALNELLPKSQRNGNGNFLKGIVNSMKDKSGNITLGSTTSMVIKNLTMLGINFAAAADAFKDAVNSIVSDVFRNGITPFMKNAVSGVMRAGAGVLGSKVTRGAMGLASTIGPGWYLGLRSIPGLTLGDWGGAGGMLGRGLSHLPGWLGGNILPGMVPHINLNSLLGVGTHLGSLSGELAVAGLLGKDILSSTKYLPQIAAGLGNMFTNVASGITFWATHPEAQGVIASGVFGIFRAIGGVISGLGQSKLFRSLLRPTLMAGGVLTTALTGSPWMALAIAGALGVNLLGKKFTKDGLITAIMRKTSRFLSKGSAFSDAKQKSGDIYDSLNGFVDRDQGMASDKSVKKNLRALDHSEYTRLYKKHHGNIKKIKADLAYGELDRETQAKRMAKSDLLKNTITEHRAKLEADERAKLDHEYTLLGWNEKKRNKVINSKMFDKAYVFDSLAEKNAKESLIHDQVEREFQRQRRIREKEIRGLHGSNSKEQQDELIKKDFNANKVRMRSDISNAIKTFNDAPDRETFRQLMAAQLSDGTSIFGSKFGKKYVKGLKTTDPDRWKEITEALKDARQGRFKEAEAKALSWAKKANPLTWVSNYKKHKLDRLKEVNGRSKGDIALAGKNEAVWRMQNIRAHDKEVNLLTRIANSVSGQDHLNHKLNSDGINGLGVDKYSAGRILSKGGTALDVALLRGTITKEQYDAIKQKNAMLNDPYHKANSRLEEDLKSGKLTQKQYDRAKKKLDKNRHKNRKRDDKQKRKEARRTPNPDEGLSISTSENIHVTSPEKITTLETENTENSILARETDMLNAAPKTEAQKAVEEGAINNTGINSPSDRFHRVNGSDKYHRSNEAHDHKFKEDAPTIDSPSQPHGERETSEERQLGHMTDESPSSRLEEAGDDLTFMQWMKHSTASGFRKFFGFTGGSRGGDNMTDHPNRLPKKGGFLGKLVGGALTFMGLRRLGGWISGGRGAAEGARTAVAEASPVARALQGGANASGLANAAQVAGRRSLLGRIGSMIWRPVAAVGNSIASVLGLNSTVGALFRGILSSFGSVFKGLGDIVVCGVKGIWYIGKFIITALFKRDALPALMEQLGGGTGILKAIMRPILDLFRIGGSILKVLLNTLKLIIKIPYVGWGVMGLIGFYLYMVFKRSAKEAENWEKTFGKIGGRCVGIAVILGRDGITVCKWILGKLKKMWGFLSKYIPGLKKHAAPDDKKPVTKGDPDVQDELKNVKDEKPDLQKKADEETDRKKGTKDGGSKLNPDGTVNRAINSNGEGNSSTNANTVEGESPSGPNADYNPTASLQNVLDETKKHRATTEDTNKLLANVASLLTAMNNNLGIMSSDVVNKNDHIMLGGVVSGSG